MASFNQRLSQRLQGVDPKIVPAVSQAVTNLAVTLGHNAKSDNVRTAMEDGLFDLVGKIESEFPKPKVVEPVETPNEDPSPENGDGTPEEVPEGNEQTADDKVEDVVDDQLNTNVETESALESASDPVEAMPISEALSKLDTKNDDHWTKSGLPAVEAVESILGYSVTRAEIEADSPELNRESVSTTKEN